MKALKILLIACAVCFADGVIPDEYPLLQNIMDYSLYHFGIGLDSKYESDKFYVSYKIPERQFRKGFVGYETELASSTFDDVVYNNSADYTIHKESFALLFKINADIYRYNINEYLKYKERYDSLIIDDYFYKNIDVVDYLKFKPGIATNLLKKINEKSSLVFHLGGTYSYYNGYSYDEIIKKSYSGNNNYVNVRYDNYNNRRNYLIKMGLGYWYKFNGRKRKHQILLDLSYSYFYDSYHPEIIDGLTGYATIVNEDLPVTSCFDGKIYSRNKVRFNFSLGEQNPEFVSLLERYRFGWLNAKFTFKKVNLGIEYYNSQKQLYTYLLRNPIDNNSYELAESLYKTDAIDLYLSTEFRAYLFKRFFIDVTLQQELSLYDNGDVADYISLEGIGAGGVEIVKRDKIVMEFGLRVPGMKMEIWNKRSTGIDFNTGGTALYFNLQYLVGRKNEN